MLERKGDTMLKLVDITKDYTIGENTVHALKGVSIEFRKSEFVSILGPSGCGKTTLLNIIGGLDKYTSGDLIINGVSTKKYSDRDWDSYRNHSIGFVFQSYNLIPHQTVLSNVELALTLSGVSKEERRKKATEALERVGLGDQLNKKPNQMSGGQMQRVAIARAIVNNPDILLADEPTGALDSSTSVDIMNILKELSREKLIVMVTHNPDLANEYSTRIINLRDGEITSDSNPYTYKGNEEKQEVGNAVTLVTESGEYKTGVSATSTGKKDEGVVKKQKRKTKKRVSMSFFTALLLSLNNLLTKKGRTFLTAFAGSIGIIGIALILSVSAGVSAYIDDVEQSTASAYPITINKETTDTNSMLASLMKENETGSDPDKIYSNDVMISMITAMKEGQTTNDLASLKEHIEGEGSILYDYVNDIKFRYRFNLNTYTVFFNEDGSISNYKRNMSGLSQLMAELTGAPSQDDQASAMTSMGTSSGAWSELIGDSDYIASQYDLIDGRFPENENEVILIVNDKNQISDYILYILGLRDLQEIKDYIMSNPDDLEDGDKPGSLVYTFDELYGYRFRILLDSDYYKLEGDRIVECTEADIYSKMSTAREISIVGIVKPGENSQSSAVGAIGYLPSLMTSLINDINESDVVTYQMENAEIDCFSGNPFEYHVYTVEEAPFLRELFISQSPENEIFINMMTDEQIAAFATQTLNTSETYSGNLARLGHVDLSDPSAILLYPKDFDAKDDIASYIDEYGKEHGEIVYTDTVALLMKSVTTILDAITYVLVAFVSISLIVSSIMIGIITYISVLERTKEIGILRSIGASKKDVSRVFNAETLIVGFVAGLLGILVSLALIVLINVILFSLTGLTTLKAQLPFVAAIILIAISMLLTFIAGLVPSRIAAKKDPVIALRTE